MTKWLALLMSCLALGLLVTACGDDDDDDSGGSAETTEQPADTGGSDDQASGGGGAGGAEGVALKDISFIPDNIEVAAGTTVTWTNEESVGHDVTKTEGPGPDFSSGDAGAMAQGDTFEHTFDAAGTFEYVCTVHPNMTGTVTVTG